LWKNGKPDDKFEWELKKTNSISLMFCYIPHNLIKWQKNAYFMVSKSNIQMRESIRACFMIIYLFIDRYLDYMNIEVFFCLDWNRKVVQLSISGTEIHLIFHRISITPKVSTWVSLYVYWLLGYYAMDVWSKESHPLEKYVNIILKLLIKYLY